MKPRLKHISIDDHYRFPYSVHIANACFGKNYKGWQRATLNVHGEKSNDFPWLPKMAVVKDGIETAQDQVYGCINTINEEGTIIREMHSSADGVYEDKVRYVFMKPQGEPYRYIGNFKKDNEASSDECSVYRRVSTELDLSEWCDEPLNLETPIEYFIDKNAR